jgi:diguanylate cyclase (GGDEF)-like protein
MTSTRASERRRRGGSARVYGLCAVLVGAAAVLYATSVSSTAPLPAPFRIPWPALLIAFTVAEVFVVHLHLRRREAHSFSLTEIPLIIGLVFATPTTLIATGVAGSVAALVLHRRQTGVKLAFNASHQLLQTCFAVAVFRAVLGSGDPTAWRGTVAAFTVTISASLLASASVSAAIALHQGRVAGTGLREAVVRGVVVAAANTRLALLAVAVLWHAVAASWVLAVVVGLAVLAYRSHSGLSEGFSRLEDLYAFTRDIAVGSGDVAHSVLEHTGALLGADRVELVLLSNQHGPRLHVTLDPGSEPGVEESAPLDDAWFAAALEGTGVCLTRGHGVAGAPREGLAAPLVADGAVIGVLVVAGRTSDVSTFEPDDLRLLEALANHATIALEKSRLIGRLRQEVAEKEHQSLHDSLTGLANRRLFHRAVEAAIGDEEAAGTVVAVMDLDRFKDVNDTLGHQMGDLLLRQVGTRLAEHVGASGTVARLGGDEFAVVFTNTSRLAASAHAAELLVALQRPVRIGDLSLSVAASIGIAIGPEHGRDATTLLQRADVAMYGAKASSGGVEVYHPGRDQHSRRRLALLNDLHHAIERSDLTVYFQPKADLADGTIVGVEALARWPHATHGMVPPDDFVPLAEQAGLIRPLTMFVLETALEATRSWRALGLHVPVAVNVSIQSLLDLSIVDDVQRLLRATDTPPSDLTLEITETTVMADPTRTLEVLAHLNQVGISLAIDDFGTGHSSLAYLKRLPVDEVKVDKSFVMPMIGDPTDEAIVRSVIELGHNLGLRVTAEGVEDQATWDRLRSLGCDVAQGYLLSRPVPADELSCRWTAGAPPPVRPQPVVAVLEHAAAL